MTTVSSLPEVHVEPHKKQLHVTLAYHFPTNHLSSLEKLAKGIEVKLGCDWLAVLFSRDIRFANHEVGGACRLAWRCSLTHLSYDMSRI